MKDRLVQLILAEEARVVGALDPQPKEVDGVVVDAGLDISGSVCVPVGDGVVVGVGVEADVTESVGGIEGGVDANSASSSSSPSSPSTSETSS
eukprot:gnl/Chilomastix_caulleri/1173.p1 GENE.gnl/Chilomastix_caulleri/1173~~gnl/Chilomastix_caulleri/1173.p1  ORF type:complete len:93 (-),score=43.04 gnl/Chilomastix_caulleri/1173:270-548(-)